MNKPTEIVTTTLTWSILFSVALYFLTKFFMLLTAPTVEEPQNTIYNYEIYRSRTELSMEGVKDDIVTEIDNYIDSVAPESCLNGIKLFELCDEYGIDVRFAMAQAEVESHYGTKGIAAKTNIVWNVKAYDGLTATDMKKNGNICSHPDHSIEPYLKLLKNDYLVNGKTVSAEDWTYVRMARNTMAATYSGSSCFIPKYSNAKKGAKEFLKFMYSDEGYKIYAESAHLSLPLQLSEGKIDTSKWNAFEQNQAQLFSTTENIVTDYMMGKHRLYIDGGAHPFASYSFVNRMSSQNEAERVTAKQAWDSIMSIIKDRYDNEWMMNIK
jgi:hypothetical protein